MIVKELIEEAIHRSNLTPRRQQPPGSLIETGFNWLKGITGRYNNDSFLAFTMDEVQLRTNPCIHIYDKYDTFGGEDNRYFDTTEQLLSEANYPTEDDVGLVLAMAKDDTIKVYSAEHVAQNVYRWVEHPVDQFDPRHQQMVEYCKASHVRVRNVVKLNTLMVSGGQPNNIGMTKLNFVPHSTFRMYQNNYLSWSWKQLAEGEWVIYTKPYTASASLCYRLQYNKGFSYDIDTDLRIPDAYIELLIVALTHAFATEYPRLDEAQMQRLAIQLKDLETNVKVPKAEEREVLREDIGSLPMDGTMLLKGAGLFY